jgi:hypothetical protein
MGSILILVLLCGFLVYGCSYPDPIHTYDYLNRYDRMTDEYEPALSLVYIVPGASLDTYDAIVVGTVEPGEHWIPDPEMVTGYCTFFRHTLARELVERADFQHISLDPEYEGDYKTLEITAKITLFKTGSGIMRFLSPILPFLQKAGATDMQIEGRIYDQGTGEVLVEFVDRRRMLGNTPWGPTWKTMDDEWVMKQTLWGSARSIAHFIAGTDDEVNPPGEAPARSGEATPEADKPSGGG